MDEKKMPELNENQTKGQEGTPSLSWQNEPDATASATTEQTTATSEAVQENVSETVESTIQVAQDSTVIQTGEISTSGDVAIKSKKPVGLLVAIGVLAIGIIAVIAVFLMQSPEKAIHKAFSETNIALTARGEKMLAAMPAIQEMNKPIQSGASNFALTFEGLEFPEGGMEATLISNMLKGFGMRGNIVADTENSLYEVDLNLGLETTPLLDFYAMSSPDTMAFGMPICSDTMLSIALATLKEDYKASPLYTNMLKAYEQLDPNGKDAFIAMMDKQLDDYQSLLLAQVETLKTAGNTVELSKKMQSEMRARMEGIYEGAVYSKLPKDGALNVYQVDLQGAPVRKVIIDMAKYIYLESEIMDAYNSMFTAEMLGGKTYEEMMQETIIAPLEKNMPEMPTTMIVKMDSKKIVRSMTVTVNPLAATPQSTTPQSTTPQSTTSLTKLFGEFTYGADQTVEVKVDAELMESTLSQTIGMQMNFKETFTGEASDGIVSFKMLENAEPMIDMDMLMASDKDGKLNMTFSFGVHDEYMPLNVKLAMDGGVKKDGDKTIWTYPSIIASVEEKATDGTSNLLGNINLGYRLETSPLTGAFTPSRPSTPLFKMSEAELETEMSKYQAKFSEIMQQVIGIMGSMTGSPEVTLPIA